MAEQRSRQLRCDICGHKFNRNRPWVGLSRYVLHTSANWRMADHGTWNTDASEFSGPTLCLDYCLHKWLELQMIALDHSNR